MEPGGSHQKILDSTLIALIFLFGLQLVRVILPLFTYYLRDTKGVSAITLAPIALGIFALSFLAAPLRRLAGLRTALIITAGGVALLRAAEQLTFNSGFDLIFASAGVALFTMFIPIALELARPEGEAGTNRFVLALLLGLAADTAVHTAASTVDLSWHHGLATAAIVLFLAGATLVISWFVGASINQESPTNWGWARILALASFGPWLFLQLVIFQNVARLSAITGWSLPLAGLIISLANVAGLIAAAHASRAKRLPGLTLIVAVIFVVVLLLIETSGLSGALVSVTGQVLAASLISTVLTTLGWLAGVPGRMGTPAANSIGQLLFVILIFLFYVSFDMDLGFRSPIVLPFAALLVALSAIAITRGQEAAGKVPATYRPAIAAAVLLLLPLALWLTWDFPKPISPPADNDSLRVMDYNLHNGFDVDGQLDLEALAQVIEASNAGVISLQEVSRGWVINGSVDMLQWLSQRLDMPYAFGPTEGLQWGNAVLSRYPIVSVETATLPPDSLRLRRGYIQVEINAGRETLQLIDTHLHHLEPDSEIRQEQVPVLIAAWEGAPKTILMGDTNATPDSPEMMMLAEAGLVDVGALIGPTPGYTFVSAAPDRRIDYFWASPDLILTDYDITQTTASDHLPLTTTITLP